MLLENRRSSFGLRTTAWCLWVWFSAVHSGQLTVGWITDLRLFGFHTAAVQVLALHLHGIEHYWVNKGHNYRLICTVWFCPLRWASEWSRFRNPRCGRQFSEKLLRICCTPNSGASVLVRPPRIQTLTPVGIEHHDWKHLVMQKWLSWL